MPEDPSDPRRTPEETRLLLDVMLGKLATYLRMCGYDAAYALDRGVEADDRLLELARDEGRLMVTRDAELARRAAREAERAEGTDGRADGLLVDSLDVTDQLAELASAGFALALSDPERCAECNAPLVEVRPESSTPDYAPDAGVVRVWRCPECGQHFWKGSHWASVAETLAGLTGNRSD